MSWDRHTESSGRIDPAGGSSLLRHGGVDGGNVLGGIERRIDSSWRGDWCRWDHGRRGDHWRGSGWR